MATPTHALVLRELRERDGTKLVVPFMCQTAIRSFCIIKLLFFS